MGALIINQESHARAPITLTEDLLRSGLNEISSVLAISDSPQHQLRELFRIAASYFGDIASTLIVQRPGYSQGETLWCESERVHDPDIPIALIRPLSDEVMVKDHPTRPEALLLLSTTILDAKQLTLARSLVAAAAAMTRQATVKSRWRAGERLMQIIGELSGSAADPEMTPQGWWDAIVQATISYLGTGTAVVVLGNQESTDAVVTAGEVTLTIDPLEIFRAAMEPPGDEPPRTLLSGHPTTVAVPLMDGTNVIGALAAVHPQPFAYDPTALIPALGEIANVASIGVHLRNQRAQHRLVTTRTRMLAHAVADLEEAVLVVDDTGHITFANHSFAALLGSSTTEIRGLHYRALVDATAAKTLAHALKDYPRNGRTDPFDLELGRADGTSCTISVLVHHLDDLIAGEPGNLVTIRNVTERELQLKDWEWHSEHDPLTGTLNRRGLARTLTKGEAMVIYVDCDRFKSVNDTFGHLVGDQVLCLVAQRIVGAIRPVDWVARVGGDEFVIMGPPPRTERTLRRFGHRIANAIGSLPMDVGPHQLQVTASVGVTVCDQELGLDELLSRADRSMYHAKINTSPVAVTRDARQSEPSFVSHVDVVKLVTTPHHPDVVHLLRPWVDLEAGSPIAYDLDLVYANDNALIPLRQLARPRHLVAEYNRLVLTHLRDTLQTGHPGPLAISPLISDTNFARRLGLLKAMGLNLSDVMIEIDADELTTPQRIAWAGSQTELLRRLGCRIALRWGNTEGGELAILAEIAPDQLQIRIPEMRQRRPTERLLSALFVFCEELGVELAINEVSSQKDISLLRKHTPHAVMFALGTTNPTKDLSSGSLELSIPAGLGSFLPRS